MTRIAMIHTGAVVIPTFSALATEHLPGVEVQHLLDSTIVGDLGGGADHDQIAQRLSALGRAAKASGADAVVFTCSSISGYASEVADAVGLPVLRIDEAMADDAVAAGARIGVVATLETTLRPTAALLRERADLARREVELVEVVVTGAFDAVVAGDRARHDELVGASLVELAARTDVIVLAQASMASAAASVDVAVPVLTSPERGVRRVADAVRAR
ncbi:aspartate/glutamate racemase family protein [uncultured Schumannella sp.]|uniref:aspartate/glutamate racemase family protein n=1 Tax=uncultured Schumannella sp. TaxID=1195956 RepID=UPI0025ED3C01|nr:aspartate/glutamate racemase family protein [uncultured Schumannella sp.]